MTSPMFDVQELGANVATAYMADYAVAPSGSNTRKMKQAVRAGIANGTYQAGFLYPQVAKFITSLGIKEAVAVQATYQGLAMYAMDYMMKSDNVGFGASMIEGVTSAYVGNAIASKMKM